MEIDFVNIIFSKEIHKKPKDIIFYKNLKNLNEIIQLSQAISTRLLAFRGRGDNKEEFETKIREEYALRMQPLIEAILIEFQSKYQIYSNFEIDVDTFKQILENISQSTIEKEKIIIKFQIIKRTEKHFQILRLHLGEDKAKQELAKDILKGEMILNSLKSRIIENIYENYVLCYVKNRIKCSNIKN